MGSRVPRSSSRSNPDYLSDQMASYAVGNIALARRSAPDGRILNHVIVTLVQKRGVQFRRDSDNQLKFNNPQWFVPRDDGKVPGYPGDCMQFRGGCTLIFDLDDLTLLYAISKPLDDHKRMVAQFQYTNGSLSSAPAMYFGNDSLQAAVGPFAMMHTHVPGEGGCHGC